MNINYYLAVGTRENWKLAFANGNVWGLKVNRKVTYDRLKSGDVVFFYVQAPIQSVVGYGSITAKSRAAAPFFTDDFGAETKYPFRFIFEVLCPSSGSPLNGAWVSLKGLVKGRTLKKFHELGPVKGPELLSRCREANA